MASYVCYRSTMLNGIYWLFTGHRLLFDFSILLSLENPWQIDAALFMRLADVAETLPEVDDRCDGR